MYLVASKRLVCWLLPVKLGAKEMLAIPFAVIAANLCILVADHVLFARLPSAGILALYPLMDVSLMRNPTFVARFSAPGNNT